MTFCLGMKVEDGLVGIADTRVTSGAECITAGKVSIHQHGRHSMFLMTSGLRSVRDKAVTYFDEAIGESDQTFDKLFKAVNVFATQIRRVADEDRDALGNAGLIFNLHALVGGQLTHPSLDRHACYVPLRVFGWLGCEIFVQGKMIGAATLAGVERPVTRDAQQPGAHLAVAAKVGCAFPDGQHDILQDFLGVLPVPKLPDEVVEHAKAVAFVQRVHRVYVARGYRP